MITRKDIEELRDAYRDLEQNEHNLSWRTTYREQKREELHRAHADVVEAHQRIDAAKVKIAALETKIGVGK